MSTSGTKRTRQPDRTGAFRRGRCRIAGNQPKDLLPQGYDAVLSGEGNHPPSPEGAPPTTWCPDTPPPSARARQMKDPSNILAAEVVSISGIIVSDAFLKRRLAEPNFGRSHLQ